MKILKKAKSGLRVVYYETKSRYYKLTRGKLEDKIIFTTTQGSYTCNPKAICEEIIREGLPYKLVWAVFNRNVLTDELRSQYPKQVKIVRKGSREYFKEFYTSKVIVDNEHNFGRRFFCKVLDDQFLIQTWHGSMGLKRIAVDNSKQAHRIIKKNLKYQNKVSVCISNSDFETNTVFRTTYWPNTKILEYGHARNDILFQSPKSSDVKKIDEKVRKFLKIDKDKHIFLYAPTFRESNKTEGREKIDYEGIKKALEKKFGGEWEIVIRFHEKERSAYPTYAEENGVIDATLYPDMQELLVCADCGVTDYSSWICDFVLTRKPGFIYATDIEKYMNSERGFYYKLTTTPFPISRNSEELINNIKNFDQKKYDEGVTKFLNDRGSKEDGKASKRIVELIKKQMNKQ